MSDVDFSKREPDDVDRPSQVLLMVRCLARFMSELQREMAKDASLGPSRAQDLEIVILNFCFTNSAFSIPMLEQRFVDRDSDAEMDAVDAGCPFVAFLASYYADRISEPAFDFLWYWISSAVTLPLTRGTAKVLLHFLDYAGPSMRRRYGRQFLKMLNVVEGRVREIEVSEFARHADTAVKHLRRCLEWLKSMRG